MDEKKPEALFRKFLLAFGFFVWVWIVVIAFLLICSFLLSKLERGSEFCDICGSATSQLNEELPQLFSIPGFGQEEWKVDEEDNTDPYYNSPDPHFEHVESGLNFTDSLFFSYGVTTSSGSDFFPETYFGFSIGYVLILIGFPLMFVLLGLISNYVKNVVSYLDRRLNWILNLFKPNRPTKRKKDPYYQEQCCCPCGRCQLNVDRCRVYDPTETQVRTGTCGLIRKIRHGMRDKPPCIPQNLEAGNDEEEKSSVLELPIAFVLCVIFVFITVFIVREEHWIHKHSIFMVSLWFTTAGSLDFRASTIFRNLLLMSWGIVGIGIFSVYFELMSKLIEQVLRKMFDLILSIFAEEEEGYNVDEEIRPKYQCTKASPGVLYFDPYNYARERNYKR